MENRLNLTAPWETYRNILAAFFERDESVTMGDLEPIEGIENRYIVTVDVNNRAKASALKKILRKSAEFGIVGVDVVVTDTLDDEPLSETLKIAFAGNEFVRRVVTVTDRAKTEHTFVLCEPSLIQFWNDDMSDYMGNFNALAADAARKLFDEQAHYTTVDQTEKRR